MTDKFKQDPLRFVLNAAYAQAMQGKGNERHGQGLPFQSQIWSIITKTVGLGFPLGQACKKWDEAQRMKRDVAVRELLGAIIYLAMAVITLLNGAPTGEETTSVWVRRRGNDSPKGKVV